eukprot:1354805-Pleurochrysis_carterae.AAC.1
MSLGNSIDRACKVQLFYILRDALARSVRDVGGDGRILLFDGHVPADVGALHAHQADGAVGTCAPEHQGAELHSKIRAK